MGTLFNQDWRRARLLAAVDRLGGQAAAGRQLGYSSGAFLRQMLTGDRAITEKTVAAIEALPGMRGWFAPETPNALVAQDVSQLANTLPPLVFREDIVAKSRNLPAVFRLEVTDASGGPDFPRGSHILWSTTRRAEVPRVVLVKDKHNQLHIRRMQQGKAPGDWDAVPLAPGFVTLNSHSDQLEIVATFDGYQLPPE